MLGAGRIEVRTKMATVKQAQQTIHSSQQASAEFIEALIQAIYVKNLDGVRVLLERHPNTDLNFVRQPVANLPDTTWVSIPLSSPMSHA